ncbi:MAG: MerR family transcriptional regulator [Lachnotalea sp.]
MKIGELSTQTGISEYTLRYYEKKELIRVERDQNDRRSYVEKDIEWIRFIKKLKETGMLLRDIKR